MNFEELKGKTLEELRQIAKDYDIKSVSKFRKSELIEEILRLEEEKSRVKPQEIIVPEIEEEKK
ncbi:MAG: hypothetical protein KatS3mg079_156 [Caloramator sp.]|nr:MAG: hypothetical protein KatS3mg079_156 [Caloramator sp.]